MRRMLLSIVALMLVIFLTSCATVSVKSKLDKTVSLTSMKGASVRSFDVKQRAIWLLWGAIPLNVPKVDQVVGPRVEDRTGIQNLKVQPKINIVDTLVTVLTVGIVTTKTISISGEVYD